MLNNTHNCYRENQNRHLFRIFFKENRTVYGKMWENNVEPDKPQITIWRMRFACWITKVTNTHTEYVIIFAYPLQQWLQERAVLLRYTHIACLVFIIIHFKSINLTFWHWSFTFKF